MSYTPIGTKVGRPPDPYRRYMRDLFSEWSDRTFARYWSAFNTLRYFGGDDAYLAALAEATRPNGSLNVAVLERRASQAVAIAVMKADS
jgi:hypothetical protein